MAVELYIVIEKLPERCEMTFDGAPVVLGQRYLKADQKKFEIQNPTGMRGIPFDEFQWRAEEKAGAKSQNSAITLINFNTSEIPKTPDSQNSIVSMDHGEEFNISDRLDYETYFDRVKVLKITGNGYWMLNGSPVKEGDEIMWYALYKQMKFICSEHSGKENYAKIKFVRKAGDVEIDGDFSVQVNVVSLAELEVLQDVSDTEEAPYAKRFSFAINRQLRETEFDIDLDVSINEIGLDPGNKIEVVKSVGDNLEITSNGTENVVELNEDPYGNFTFSFLVTSQVDFTEGDKVQVTLNAVDSSSDNVNPSKNSLIFNLK